MAEHTKGELRFEKTLDQTTHPHKFRYIIDTDKDILVAFTINDTELDEANARRICFCVNSHDALVEELTDYKEGCEGLKLSVQELRTQRDALLAAGEELLVNELHGITPYFDKAIRKMEQAIAKAKEDK